VSLLLFFTMRLVAIAPSKIYKDGASNQQRDSSSQCVFYFFFALMLNFLEKTSKLRWQSTKIVELGVL
jgi:hypothetical protein